MSLAVRRKKLPAYFSMSRPEDTRSRPTASQPCCHTRSPVIGQHQRLCCRRCTDGSVLRWRDHDAGGAERRSVSRLTDTRSRHTDSYPSNDRTVEIESTGAQTNAYLCIWRSVREREQIFLLPLSHCMPNALDCSSEQAAKGICKQYFAVLLALCSREGNFSDRLHIDSISMSMTSSVGLL